MSCNQSEALGGPSRIGRLGVICAAALSLSACQTMQQEGAAEPQPMAMPAIPGGAEPVYRVRSGSASVLAKFPKGTVVSKSSEICLKQGEQITISGNNGQSVTYTGPGCAKRNARPTRDNEGGFTFGWNDFDAEAERARAR